MIAEVAIGLAGFSGVFVALTQTGSLPIQERFRLRFLLRTSLGAMFLAMLPYAVFTRSWSEQVTWLVLGSAITVYTGLLVPFGFKAVSLRRQYPDLFPVRAIALQAALILAAFGLSVAVLFAPLEDKLSGYIGVLLLLLAQATVVFIRLLFHRRA